MSGALIGGALAGIGSLAGGLLGFEAQKKANKINKEYNAQQYDLARNSIKYRVQDAKNAGIHPLYALGAPSMSSSGIASRPNTALARGIENMGQSVGDAVRRHNSYESTMKRLDAHYKSAMVDNITLKNTREQIEMEKALLELRKLKQSQNKGQNTSRSSVFGWKTGDASQSAVEDEYGDILGEVYGIGHTIKDFYNNEFKPLMESKEFDKWYRGTFTKQR